MAALVFSGMSLTQADAGGASAATKTSTQSDALSGSLTVDYGSQYLFRFVDMGDNLVATSLDAQYAVNQDWNLVAQAWFGTTNNTSLNELDLTFGVGYQAEMFDAEFGYKWYNFTNLDHWNSQELYLKLGTELPWDMRLEATTFWDIQRYNGLYIDTNISKSFDITENLALRVKLGIGYADGNSRQISASNLVGTRDGYQGWYAMIDAPWKITDRVTLCPYLMYADADSNLVTSVTDFTSGQANLVGGLRLSISF